jgi:protein-tyrosine phosphatase
MLPVIYEVVTIGTGKLSVMPMPASGEGVAGLRQLGIDHVVSLLEVDEQSDVGLAEEEANCIKSGMRYTSFPITDRDVPQKADALALAATLHRDISSGEHVVIHCRAGIGRTGMIASAVLIQAGYSSGEAIHIVSFARGALIPDTVEQENWIKQLLVSR